MVSIKGILVGSVMVQTEIWSSWRPGSPDFSHWLFNCCGNLWNAIDLRYSDPAYQKVLKCSRCGEKLVEIEIQKQYRYRMDKVVLSYDGV